MSSNNNNNNNNNNNDEAMAAAMQEKYRLQFLQRQARKNASARATAPPDVDVMGSRPSKAVTRPSESVEQRLAGPSKSSIPSDQETKDAALARKLAESNESEDASLRMAQQLQDEEMAYQLSREQAPRLRSTTSTSNTSGSSYLQGVVEDDDMVLARQVAQEAEDADLARQYTTYEQEAASRQQGQRQQTNKKSFFGRVVPLLCCAAAISIPLLFVFGVFNVDNVPGLDFNWDDFIDNDPFDGQIANRTNPKASASWNNNGKGLTLEVLNAMQDQWETTFETALVNWDNGSPDALTLVTRRVTYDVDCAEVNNKLKVCNGNYGNTKWRGLNQIAIRGGTIFLSTAKMNEYYLTSASADARLYTMCHEIGHGFGLPHWDEDFRNKDLGNCMDYTIRPQDNKTPDFSNFQFLAELYGTKDGYVSPTTEDDTTGETSTAADAAAGGGTRGRLSRRAEVELEQEQAVPSLSDMEWQQLQPVYQQAMREFYDNHERRLQGTDAYMSAEENAYIYSNSRLLYATDYLESHEIEVSEDIVVQVHFVLA